MTDPDATAPARALAAVLARENAALAALDLPAATALLAAKQAALAAFAAAPPPGVAARALAPVLREVQALATENRALLARAIAVQSRVIALVAGAGVPATATGTAYRPRGSRALPPRPDACTLLARA